MQLASSFSFLAVVFLENSSYVVSIGFASTGLSPACCNFSIRTSSCSPRFTNLACHSFLYGRRVETSVRATSKLRYHLRLAGTMYHGASSALHLERASPY